MRIAFWVTIAIVAVVAILLAAEFDIVAGNTLAFEPSDPGGGGGWRYCNYDEAAGYWRCWP